MPFSRRPAFRFPIESETLTILPWNDHDLVYDLELRYVKPN